MEKIIISLKNDTKYEDIVISYDDHEVKIEPCFYGGGF